MIPQWGNLIVRHSSCICLLRLLYSRIKEYQWKCATLIEQHMEHEVLMCVDSLGRCLIPHYKKPFQVIKVAWCLALQSSSSCKQTTLLLLWSPLTEKLVLMLTDSKLAPPFDIKYLRFLMCGMICISQWLHVCWVMTEFVILEAQLSHLYTGWRSGQSGFMAVNTDFEGSGFDSDWGLLEYSVFLQQTKTMHFRMMEGRGC